MNKYLKLEESINNFCKSQEDFVMNLLDSAQDTSEKIFVLEKISVHNLLPLADTIFGVPLLDELTSYTSVGENSDRHEALYLPSYIDELCEYFSGQKTKDELVDEMIDFVKKNKVIGAYYDW